MPPLPACLDAPRAALRPALLGVALLNGAAGVVLVALAWCLADTLNALVFHDTGPTPLRLGTVAALLLARAALMAAAQGRAAALGFEAGRMVRRRLVEGLLARSTPVPPGSLALVGVEGIDAIEPFFARYLPATFHAVLLPVVVLVVVVPMDPLSALVLAGTAPLIPLFMLLIGHGTQTLNAAQWAEMTRASAYFLDVVRALPLVRAFAAVPAERQRLATAASAWCDGTVRVLRLAFLSALVLEFLATLGVALVAVFIGFRLLWGQIEFERGLFVLLLAPEFYLPLRSLGVHYHARLEAQAAAERLAALIEDENAPPSSAPESPTPESPASQAAPLRPEEPSAPRVEVAGVSFAYPGHAPVLEDCSFTLEPGTLTALVGASGAGKSTLLALLRGRLTPQAGTIRVDGVPPGAEAARPAWIPQEPHPFAGTLAEAVRLGAPDAPDEAVSRALDLAHATPFVAERPQGLDAPIGEGGAGLSGGELRRLALARAFLMDAPLVLLDEPSASLDHESETALIAALQGLRRGRTVLVAAHRLATIRAADRVLVLAGGRVAQEGLFETLRASDGPLRALLGAGAPLVGAALEETSR
ncbi:thiol reductant ABC exporter subunit CydD [Pararhodospirillum oryzae]|uniref:Thiol reductant ABC exporter subunit CydD n=1 Tax=Pararhodospirillum oryzae TaxID=478448 RepID=A0A512H758_9PROT|nr:thiol reductant ABC exporter subunit CydD [Pararhodospirillum oryzae]GEO81220.1 thiol reductant ABC exporter subunit CydD [Pararhodospirillum oryzae]